MPPFNEINPDNWAKTKIITDTFWNFPRRDSTGKHSNFYHGNFAPQIVRQFILRYTRKGETVFEPFLGGGTTAYEAEKLKRNCIGIDLQENLIKNVQSKIDTKENFIELIAGDSTNEKTYENVSNILESHHQKKVQLVILHPPYFNMIKFSQNNKDLSNSNTIQEFWGGFSKVVKNCKAILEKDRYMVLVIMDMVTSGWKKFLPLGFYSMGQVEDLGLELKGIVVKNANSGRGGKEELYKRKALESDFYNPNHEYCFIFKNSA